LVRALLAADKNQQFNRSRATQSEREAFKMIDYRPFIIADADTGHGGEAHVRNLIRRFVEVGVPGYHIEDQKPGVKKCGHQGGKVLVGQDEQNKRLNAARFQLDVMKVPGIIVARTDAEAATLIEGRGDESDQPFILGATNGKVPTYKVATLAILKAFYQKGIETINGHLLYRISDDAYDYAFAWMAQVGLDICIADNIAEFNEGVINIDVAINNVSNKFIELWQIDAGLKTFGKAVADVMKFNLDEGSEYEFTVAQWLTYASSVSFQEAREKARHMGVNIIWDCELSKTPEGYYQVEGGIDYAIAKSLAAAPFADLIWMETKTANLADAKVFAKAIHAKYPDQMLAYNLSPSFSWDTTGMSEAEMQVFPEELGKLGYVFNFITYGGHQVDGLAGEEFATALMEDGMLALARLQRKFRLLNSPYKTPQSHVGGPRIDAALMATTGRTATTKAMGKGSTQFQHLVQTEVPISLLNNWLGLWTGHNQISLMLQVSLRPHHSGSDLLELNVLDEDNNKIADVIFDTIKDRRGRNILSIRDINNYEKTFRKKRLMTLLQLFLIHRYEAVATHYLSPTDDNQKQAEGMKSLTIYEQVNTEIGDIIVATVNTDHIKDLLNPINEALMKLISKT
jgi:isocitrate lyase